MRKLFVFNMVTVDGLFEGKDHDISWHNTDSEFNDFAIEQLNEIDTILFGRVTYEMMKGYWPTELVKNDDPIVASKMNNTKKIVFSKTLENADWENTTFVKENIKEEILKLKQMEGKDIAIFGSGKLNQSLMELGLVDEIRLIINPLILSEGTALFQNLKMKYNLELLSSRVFKNGNVLLCYTIKD